VKSKSKSINDIFYDFRRLLSLADTLPNYVINISVHHDNPFQKE